MLMAYRGKVFGDAERVACNFKGLHLRELDAGEARRLADYCERNQVQCIHGHFTLAALHDVFSDRRCITFVRDPVDRLVSAYNHMYSTVPDVTQAMSFEEFVRMERTRNVYDQVGLLDHLEDVEFVGLTEQYDRSLELLGHKFPDLQGLKINQANVSQDKRMSRRDVTPQAEALLREMNAPDFEIYEAVKDWFLAECEAYGV